MSDPLLEAYEAFPYESRPISASDVSRIETLGLLFGMTPAPADACRVLELGCAAGANMIAMADRFPMSEFIGIDLAPSQIAEGQRAIDALHLSNVKLAAMSIADVGDDFGTFDYIVCHGVYSWVPAAIQDAILRVCSSNLDPSGLAYVSYNTFPGWHVRGMVRDMIMYHDDPTLSPTERVARGRHLVELLSAVESGPLTVHAATLREELDVLQSISDTHFLHEQLEPYNEPIYFAEFAKRAAKRGLEFVAESPLATSTNRRPPWLKSLLGDGEPDPIRLQQYFDFARGRTFRCSILRHAGTPALRDATAAVVPRLYVTSRSSPASADEPPAPEATSRPGAAAFRSPDKVTVTTNNPIVIAALTVLFEARPRYLGFGDLLERSRARLKGMDLSEEALGPNTLAGALLECAMSGLVELSRCSSRAVGEVTDRPVALRLARHRAATSALVPNAHHYTIQVADIERFVLVCLDGTRTKTELVSLVEEAITTGGLVSSGSDVPTHAQVEATVDAVLTRFKDSALLEA
jgi:methyltransferase-like protein